MIFLVDFQRIQRHGGRIVDWGLYDASHNVPRQVNLCGNSVEAHQCSLLVAAPHHLPVVSRLHQGCAFRLNTQHRNTFNSPVFTSLHFRVFSGDPVESLTANDFPPRFIMGQEASREREAALAALKPINNAGKLPTSPECLS